MGIYLDTSALVPLFFHEAASAALRGRLRKERELWVSHWTLAEFSSAVAFKIRAGHTTAATAQAAHGKLQAVLTQGGLHVAEVQGADFERAAQLCTAHASGLRTPDALHAAIAARLRCIVLTADRGQAVGCQYHGIGHELLAP